MTDLPAKFSIKQEENGEWKVVIPLRYQATEFRNALEVLKKTLMMLNQILMLNR